MANEWTPKKIRALREEFDESQEVFSRRLGVSVDAFRIWEQGRGVPAGSAKGMLDRLKQDIEIAKLLGVHVDEVLDTIKHLAQHQLSSAS